MDFQDVLWLIAVAGGVIYLIVRLASAISSGKRWNRTKVPEIRGVLAELKRLYGPLLFAIPTNEGIHLLFSERHIHFLHAGSEPGQRTQVSRSETLEELRELVIVQGMTKHAAFNLVFSSADASSTFTTHSLADITRLFNLMLDVGKDVRFARS